MVIIEWCTKGQKGKKRKTNTVAVTVSGRALLEVTGNGSSWMDEKLEFEFWPKLLGRVDI